MHFRTIWFALIPVSVFFSACVNSGLTPNFLGDTKQNSVSHAIKFQTNQSTFLNTLEEANQSVEKRNAFMDEFLFKSDMQCQHFLDTPAVANKPQTNEEKSLYMSMFDTVSFLFGTKAVTDMAKQAFSDNSAEGEASKETYKDALSTEIRQGVKIARGRYAQQMLSKKHAPLTQYTTNALQKDMLTYDQQCSDEYGLIEINRALKAAQYQMTQPQAAAAPAINPIAIKDKVEAATKKVEKEKVETTATKETNSTELLETKVGQK